MNIKYLVIITVSDYDFYLTRIYLHLFVTILELNLCYSNIKRISNTVLSNNKGFNNAPCRKPPIWQVKLVNYVCLYDQRVGFRFYRPAIYKPIMCLISFMTRSEIILYCICLVQIWKYITVLYLTYKNIIFKPKIKTLILFQTENITLFETFLILYLLKCL